MTVRRSFAIYVAVGVFCAVLDIGTMQLMISAGADALMAASVAFFLSLFVNYFLQSRLTFKTAGTPRSFLRFLVLVAINYGITMLLVFASVQLLHQAMIGKIVSLPLIAVNGFLLGKHWVFDA